MQQAAIYNQVEFGENKPTITILLETSFTREIRILMKEGHIMKEHKTSYPIVVEIVDGYIDFDVEGKTLSLKKGELIALEGSVPHSLKANKDSIIRLTLTKSDQPDRVQNVIDN